jgi:hypothetical protein
MLSSTYSRPIIGQIPSLYYATKAVNNSDIDYFIDSFDSKYNTFRDTYLNTKETLMGLSYRYSHYTPLDFERKLKDKVDLILARWEQWFIRTLELTKGMAHLKKELLVKKQYEASGLSITETRRNEMNTAYFNLLYQYEINEKDRLEINSALTEVKLQTYGSVPGLYDKMEAAQRGDIYPVMNMEAELVNPPPKLTCTFEINL